jgi:hypothetical protein
MSDTYIVLTNWSRYQHYSGKNPGWVKFHNSILTSPAWVHGDNHQKALMAGLILLAGRFHNAIPLHACSGRAAIWSHDCRNRAAIMQRLRNLESFGFLKIEGKSLDLEEKSREEKSREEKNMFALENSANAASSEGSLLSVEASPAPKPALEKPKQPLSDEAERLAQLLLSEIQKNRPQFPTKQAQLQQWAEVADKMLRLDGRSFDEVCNVIRWAQSDDFEKVNVLSMEKIRKRFDQLAMKRQANGSAQQKCQSFQDRRDEEFLRRWS